MDKWHLFSPTYTSEEVRILLNGSKVSRQRAIWCNRFLATINFNATKFCQRVISKSRFTLQSNWSLRCFFTSRIFIIRRTHVIRRDIIWVRKESNLKTVESIFCSGRSTQICLACLCAVYWWHDPCLIRFGDCSNSSNSFHNLQKGTRKNIFDLIKIIRQLRVNPSFMPVFEGWSDK